MRLRVHEVLLDCGLLVMVYREPGHIGECVYIYYIYIYIYIFGFHFLGTKWNLTTCGWKRKRHLLNCLGFKVWGMGFSGGVGFRVQLESRRGKFYVTG